MRQDECQSWKVEQASETLRALGGLSVQCQWKTPLAERGPVTVDLTTRFGSVRFALFILRFRILSETPPSVDNTTRKPSLKHILVADTILPL